MKEVIYKIRPTKGTFLEKRLVTDNGVMHYEKYEKILEKITYQPVKSYNSVLIYTPYRYLVTDYGQIKNQIKSVILSTLEGFSSGIVIKVFCQDIYSIHMILELDGNLCRIWWKDGALSVNVSGDLTDYFLDGLKVAVKDRQQSDGTKLFHNDGTNWYSILPNWN